MRPSIYAVNILFAKIALILWLTTIVNSIVPNHTIGAKSKAFF